MAHTIYSHTPRGNLEFPVKLMCMDCGREQEYLEKTSTDLHVYPGQQRYLFSIDPLCVCIW